MANPEIRGSGDGSPGDASLKPYYEALGVREGAPMEEVTARYLSLRKQIISAIERGQKPDRTIPQINEAYVKLKESKIPLAVNFDLEEHLRKSYASVRAERRRARRRKTILASGLGVAILLVGVSLWVLEKGKETVPPGSPTAEDPNRKVRGSLEKASSFSSAETKPPEKMARASAGEPGKSTPPSISDPAVSRPSAREPSKISASKEERSAEAEKPKPSPPMPSGVSFPKPEDQKTDAVASWPPPLKPSPPIEVAKVAPLKPTIPPLPESPKPASEIRERMVEPPQQISRETVPTLVKEPEASKPKMEVTPLAGAPVSQPPAQAEVAKPDSQRESSPGRGETVGTIPQERASMIGKEPQESKGKGEIPVVPPAPQTIPPAVVAKAAPAEESPIPKPESVKPSEPAPAREPKVASLASSAIASDQEVRNFFENYLFKYNRKEINGFLSLFSARAIQNQKDDLEKIRKTYETFFAQMESVNYKIAISRIEPRQDQVEVRAQYELEGIVAKGRKAQSWKGQIRWVLVREGEALKIISLDYQPQSGK